MWRRLGNFWFPPRLLRRPPRRRNALLRGFASHTLNKVQAASRPRRVAVGSRLRTEDAGRLCRKVWEKPIRTYLDTHMYAPLQTAHIKYEFTDCWTPLLILFNFNECSDKLASLIIVTCYAPRRKPYL